MQKLHFKADHTYSAMDGRLAGAIGLFLSEPACSQLFRDDVILKTIITQILQAQQWDADSCCRPWSASMTLLLVAILIL